MMEVGVEYDVVKLEGRGSDHSDLDEDFRPSIADQAIYAGCQWR